MSEDKPKSGRGGARPNTGGARPGAGRKPGKPAGQLSIYLTHEIAPDAADLIAALDRAAKDRGVSRAAIIVEALRKLLAIPRPFR